MSVFLKEYTIIKPEYKTIFENSGIKPEEGL